MSGFFTLRRCFQNSAIRKSQSGVTGGNKNEIASAPSVKAPPSSSNQTASSTMNFQRFVPSVLDKQFLIWSGHYKSRSEIPNAVEKEVLERSRSWARIRVNLSFMVVALIGVFAMVYQGKQAAKRGETVASKNMEWHLKIKQEHTSAQETKKAQN